MGQSLAHDRVGSTADTKQSIKTNTPLTTEVFIEVSVRP